MWLLFDGCYLRVIVSFQGCIIFKVAVFMIGFVQGWLLFENGALMEEGLI
jgi:hypothetical protein